RPFLLRLGDTGDLDSLAPREHAVGADAAASPAGDGSADATVGGGAGAP
ncbi:phosphoglycerate mutase, partial [Streptomyces sp. SID4931]